MTTTDQTSEDSALSRPASSHEVESNHSRDALTIWWVLGGWLVLNVAACISFVNWISPLGFEGIPYVLFGGPLVVAEFGLATIWMWLGDDSRLARFADIPLGIALLAIVFVSAIENQLSLYLAIFQLLIAESLPLLLLRRRGAQITRRQPTADGSGSWWRFSIADLLILTTGFAVLLALASIDGHPLEVMLGVVFFAAPTWLVACMAFRSRSLYWALCCVCLLSVVVVALMWLDGIAWLDIFPRFLSVEARLLIVIAGIQLIALTAAATVLRKLGFRLRFLVSDSERPAARN
jgi:hypothetical protein